MSLPQPKTPPQSSTSQPKRMSLTAVVKGKLEQPVRVLLYGVEGIGKSTFAAGAPAPIFLGPEDGTAQLDVTRFPAPESWVDVMEAVRVLTVEEHGYQTLVLDTLDWAEPLLWDFICKRDKHASIEDYGYGKGWNAAVDEWRVFVAALERLRKAKRMHLILLAHSWIKAFKDPESEGWDRHELKLNAKAGGLLKEWVDAVLFANYETVAHKDSKTKRVRGISTGARFIYTQHRAAYDAKNRYSLPDELPLNWDDFEAAVKTGQPADPALLTAEVERKAKVLGGKHEQHAKESLKSIKGDAARLAKLNDWLNFELTKREQTDA